MSQLVVANFAGGLDARKFFLSLPPGTLTKIVNAHITSGGEIEKRKAFVLNTTLPTGTYGAVATNTGIFVFGSFSFPAKVVPGTATWTGTTVEFTMSGTSIIPPVGTVVTLSNCSNTSYNGCVFTVTSISPFFSNFNVFGTATTSNSLTSNSLSGNANFSLPSPFTYQQLTHPDGSTQMNGVASVDLFNGQPFVAATFADGNTFCYYSGVLVEDFIAGLVAPWSDTDNQIAASLKALVNATANTQGNPTYTATATNNIDLVSSTPNISSGAPFTTTVETTLESSSTGTIAADPVTQGGASTAAVQATGSFTIVAGTATSGFATGSATINNLSAFNGTPNTADIVTIGSATYFFATSTWLAANPNANGAVLVGGTTSASVTNLVAAINGTGTPGVTYGSSTPVNTQLSAAAAGSTIDFTALASGTAGNSVQTVYVSNNHATFTFSGTTLSGGTNSSLISAVDVNGNNLLSANIPWDQTPAQTAIDVAVNINANTNSNGGFTATANNGVVTIYSLSTSAATYNGQAVSVTVSDQIIVQSMPFEITSVANGNTISSITVGGVTITSGTVTATGADTPSTFATKVATAVIGGSAGYTAVAVGPIVYISPRTSTSASTPGTMDVNYVGTGVQAINAGLLQVALSSYSIGGSALYSQGTTTQLTHGGFSTTPATFITNSVTAQPSGGVQPYTYKWTYAGNGSSQLVCQYPTLATTAWFFTRSPGSPGVTEQWICTITDSNSPAGHVVSQPVTILF